jgi:hypothetical protein
MKYSMFFVSTFVGVLIILLLNVAMCMAQSPNYPTITLEKYKTISFSWPQSYLINTFGEGERIYESNSQTVFRYIGTGSHGSADITIKDGYVMTKQQSGLQ